MLNISNQLTSSQGFSVYCTALDSSGSSLGLVCVGWPLVTYEHSFKADYSTYQLPDLYCEELKEGWKITMQTMCGKNEKTRQTLAELPWLSLDVMTDQNNLSALRGGKKPLSNTKVDCWHKKRNHRTNHPVCSQTHKDKKNMFGQLINPLPSSQNPVSSDSVKAHPNMLSLELPHLVIMESWISVCWYLIWQITVQAN